MITEKKKRVRKPKAIDLHSLYELSRTLTLAGRVDLIKQLTADVNIELKEKRESALYAEDLIKTLNNG